MKKMKKLFAVLLTLAMVFGMSMTSFAAGTTATINLTGDTLAGATITYVQIVEPDTKDSTLGWKFSDPAYATVFINKFNVKTADQAIQKLIDLGLDSNAANGTINTSSELGAALKSLKTSATLTEGVTANAITRLTKAGLYLVVAQKTGYEYLPMLAYIKDNGSGNLSDANLTVKGSKNQVLKNIDNEDDQSVSAGDRIEYTATAEYPYYSVDEEHKTFTATDTLTNATFDKTSLVINVEGVATSLVEGEGKDYTATFSNNDTTLNIEFNYNSAYAGKTVTFTYTAIAGNGEGEVVNRIKTNFDTDGDSVTSAKVSVKVIKVDKNSAKLPGAEFTLFEYVTEETEGYTKVENASVIDITSANKTAETKNIYIKKIGDAKTTDDKGEITFTGLDAQKHYYVQETNAPTGYTVKKDYYEVKGATKTSDETSKTYTFSNFKDITVDDENLSALPSTGGIGTTIFTIAGCVIMIAAAGLFFASRKKSDNK